MCTADCGFVFFFLLSFCLSFSFFFPYIGCCAQFCCLGLGDLSFGGKKMLCGGISGRVLRSLRPCMRGLL